MLRYGIGVGAVVAGLLLAGCSGNSSTPSSELPVVRFCTSGGTDLASQPLIYAQSYGLLDLYELLIERVDFADASTAFKALRAGDCDMLFSRADAGIVSIANGADIKMLAAPAPWKDDVILAGADVGKVADLAGRSVAIDKTNDIDHQAALYALQKAGLDPKSTRFVEVPGGSPARGEAIAAHKVDAAVMPVLWAARAMQKSPDLHILYDVGSAFAPKYLYKAVFATGAIVGDKRGVAQSAVDALMDASRTLVDDQEGTVESATESGLDGAVAKAAYANIFAAPIHYYAVDGGLDRNVIASTVAILRQAGRLKADIAFEKIVAPRFVKKAISTLGPSSMATPCGEGGVTADDGSGQCVQMADRS